MTEIVRNTAELSAAVTNPDVDYIYFGDNITLTAAITIPPDKESLVFDGTYEGVTHTFTDMNSSSLYDTLGVRATSDISLTFQNMHMTGRNYYGIPYVNDSLVDTSGVTVTYRDITYTGPQIAYNPLGTVHFEGCAITTTSEEVGEVGRVEFQGVNTLTHTSTTDAVFWFRGAVGTAYLRLLPGAEVTVTTTNYFMYSLIPVLGIPTTQNPVAYELQPGSSLTLTSNHGISYATTHRASSFLVDTGASFRYIQQTANGTNASLYLNGAFTVNEGASVYMEANFAGAYPLINFATGTALQLSVNNPKSFVLYDRASAPIALTAGATRNFTLSGGQINYWTAATLFPQAGGFTDTPYRKWHRPDWTGFNITGSVASGTTTVSGTSLTPEEQGGLPAVGELVFQNARVLSVGNLPITPDLAADDGRPVSGLTEPGAEVIISYTVEGTGYTFEPTADADGRFSAQPAAAIPAGTVITISANTPFLITTIEITAAAAVNEIIIQKAPPLIALRMPPIATGPVLLGRLNPGETVEVLDSRGVGTQWQLSATITGPLETADGDVLENAVVFRDDADVLWTLGDDPVVVYTGGPITGQTDVSWLPERGILVRVTEPLRSGVEYSTQLIWTVTPI